MQHETKSQHWWIFVRIISACIYIDNEKSIKPIEKLGFTFCR